jgi:hypothetical protein
VAAGQFCLYQVAHVVEGIAILTDVEAGEPDSKGFYPAQSVFGCIQRKLKAFTVRGQRLKRGDREDPDGATTL